ncbi:hypothetical protein [Sphingomonas sp. PAMC 26605]|uniref:hypothetical protein n=1 Tax=Sphingomonas sp. PAMC 26605 TaxID=1112214 RepID=UPI00026CD620|nr:hypothetical protein [Sphingomonas sp. PAMC 26605]
MRYWIALLLLFPSIAMAQRAELPIREVDLSDGTRRYTVTLVIDGQPVQAGLDTGSTGLRVLPRALNDAARRDSGPAARYSYDSGTQFRGQAIRRTLAIGAISGNVQLQRIDRVECVPDQPTCPASRVDAAHFGIQGNGHPSEGFDAIFGIRTKPDLVANPLVQLGARRWIVELPRPGEAAGRIILNPTPAELNGFTLIALDKDDTSNGCLLAEHPERVLCARALFDTGAPGLRIIGGPSVTPWPDGTRAQVTIGVGGATASMPVVIGRREQASGMFYVPLARRAVGRLSLGLAPYFHWAVLYDADRAAIGVRPR